MVANIIDYGMHGEGVAIIDGKVFLVSGALVGESVDISLLEDKGNYAIAKINNIISSSPHRVQPKCKYFSQCGGCQLQMMDYEGQLKFKTLLIKKTIRKILNLDINVADTVACDKQYNYRNKASFSYSDGKFGYYKEKSKNVLDIDYCPIQFDTINNIYRFIKQHLIPSSLNDIKHIIIRAIGIQMLVCIVASKYIDLSYLYKLLSENFYNIGLYLNINTRKDSVVLSGTLKHIGGLKEITVNNFGLTYTIDISAFQQTNNDVQNKLYSSVLEFIPDNATVVNGFSGNGLLSAIIAKRAKYVYGIEINKSAHFSAEKLKFDNNIRNLSNILGDFYKKFDTLRDKFDTIVLDPTKKGCGKQVMQAIDGTENIIYISCNPIALCKDLRVILDNYIIEEIIPFDMFPNTENVETLVKLKRRIKWF